jgi:hypothetical protein
MMAIKRLVYDTRLSGGLLLLVFIILWEVLPRYGILYARYFPPFSTVIGALFEGILSTEILRIVTISPSLHLAALGPFSSTPMKEQRASIPSGSIQRGSMELHVSTSSGKWLFQQPFPILSVAFGSVWGLPSSLLQ